MLRTFILLGALSLQVLSLSAHATIDPIIDAADRQQAKAPIITQSLSSNDPLLRMRAAQALGRTLNPESIDPLLSLLKDSDPRVVRQAIFGLGQLGWNADFNGNREKEIVSKILPFLGDPSDKTRAEAVHAIGKLAGDETPALVAQGLTDSSDRVREESVIALFRYRYAMSMRSLKFTPWSDEFSAKVLERAQDPSTPVRRALAFIYSRHTDPRGLEVEMKLAVDRDETVRVHAVNGLKRIGNISALPAILSALKDTSKEVRFAALEAIDALKAIDQISEENLKLLPADSYFAVRKKTAELLGKSSDPKNRVLYTGYLERLTKDKSRAVGGAAYSALIQLLRSGTPSTEETARVETTLASLIKSKFWQFRLAGMQGYASILDGMKPENPTPFEKQALLILNNAAKNESHILVRGVAIGKIVNQKNAAGWEMIQHVLKSEFFSERAAGLQVISSRPESEADKIALILSYYKASLQPKYDDPRSWAVEVLSEMDSEASTEALKTMLTDPSPAIVFSVTTLLKKRGVNVPEAAPVPLTFTPYRDLTFKRNPLVIFHTRRGKIVMEGLAKLAPVHVANFVGQARAGFYNGRAFQRVVSNFVVQGGADDLNGFSSSDFMLRAEMNRVRYTRGAVGCPRSSAFDSGGSQIFINQITSPWLDGLYTIFARVVRGMDVVDRTEAADRILKVEVRL